MTVAHRVPGVQYQPDWLDEYIAEENRKTAERRARAVARRQKEAQRNRPKDHVPRHVANCRKWGLWFWKVAQPSTVTRAAYSCGSWRCPHCKAHEAHVLFARAQEAFQPLPTDSVAFAVLTFARRGEAAPATINDAYREIGTRWNWFLKRLRRWVLKQGWEPLKNEWIQTIECHKDGWPHVNVVFSHPQLVEWLRERKDARQLLGDSEQRAAILLPAVLRDMAVECGFGAQSTLEVANSTDAALGYIVKIAGKHDQTIGEVAKLTQLPTMAPGRFRRCRSGKNFLPKRKSGDGTHTGTIAMRRTECDGTTTVLIPRTVEAVGEELAQLEKVRSLELNLAEEERVAFARTGKPLPRPPILVHQPLIGWFGFDSQAELASMSRSLGSEL